MSIFWRLFGEKNKDTASSEQGKGPQGKNPKSQGTNPSGKVSETQGNDLNEKLKAAQDVKQGERDIRSSESEHELAFHTRGQKNPKGLPRVFFACHPEDFELYFRRIAGMVDAFQDVAFFFERDPEKNPMLWAELSGRLSDMQLIIMPVSTRLLFTENRAVREILPFANERHIPILPIMFETGLDDKYREIFGDLEYLIPVNIDVTAIPFEQKLEKYLEGVLVGAEMAQRVRDAFDAYIFLSYRKKDRAYAQELMRMIHKSDRYRDIAIWYDEYLVPGESFNDAIKVALEKGRLFALVVTPNLLEKDNYVMLHEYPAAKDSGKPILPVQMVETDREKLKACYKEIPDSVDVHDGKAWEQAAVRYFRDLAVTKNNDDPQHTFLIGLAYLDGIDVEVDSRKAEELITGAADEGLTVAMEKLVAMYHDGKGVERDYRRSAGWRERLVNALRAAWQESRKQADLRAYIQALWELGDAYWDLKDLEAAGNAYTEMKTAAETQIEEWDIRGVRNLLVSYSKLGDIELGLGNPEGAKRNYEKALEISGKLEREVITAESRRDLAVLYNRLGDIEKGFGNLKGARRNYEKALEISEMLEREMNTAVSRRDLSLSYDRLGNIEQGLGNLEGAKKNYEKALEIREKLWREEKTAESRRDLIVSYSKLGDIEQDLGNLEGAKRNYEKALEISEKLVRETNTAVSRRDLLPSYIGLGDIERVQGNLEGAKKNYEKALEISGKLARETNTVESRRDLSIIYERIGDIEEGLGNLEEARRNYEKALGINEKLVRETNMAEPRQSLAINYGRLGDIEQRQGNLEGAKKNYEKALEISGKLARETNTAGARRAVSVSYSRIGDIEKGQGNLEGAKRNYEKALEIREKLERETKTIESRRDLSISYGRLADIEKSLGNLEGAKRNYEKALEISEKLAREMKTVSDYDDLAVTYYKIGTLDGNIDKEYLTKAFKIWDYLAQACPSMPILAQKRDYIKRLLQR